MFILFISETELAKVPGLSAAGADPEALRYTAPADADLLFYGRPKVTDAVPVDPQGHPTPSLVTRAAVLEGDIPVRVINAGASVAPAAPYTETGAAGGRDPRYGKAVPDFEKTAEAAARLAKDVGSGTKRAVIAECVPGGTTTALLLLRALGYGGTVSSASPQNPVALKEQIWRDTSSRLGIKTGGLKGRGLAAAAEVGDPMQIAAAAFVNALPENIEAVLAGGTQMLAVAALVRDCGNKRPLLVATTKYIRDDPASCFADYADAIGVDRYFAPLDFSNCPYAGLAEYEKGFVKEGVGMGGAVWYALQNGAAIESITARAEKIYAGLTGMAK